ncbi:protein-tyrosine-phosphatase [Taibaiella sp. KBW10]|uniref:low molecular weight protein-tyrosine-phosphatase n=1 Tax=Taibaiella sp. KBW10 TaxID=2153357 RepID=UPI000F59E46A|nr:low molecular weight protein-tyrosine-phosphatase [Taibaiella sp. KBW10]RQO30437.1 protein-tyrosine-phosphatase [Taibaiella sp. KBW10]
MKILVVCLGNICRSPIAEGLMRQMAIEHQLDWTVDSAGTNGYHTGEPPHRDSQSICRQNGIDISKQRSRRFTARDFDDYDHILVMAEDVYQEVKRIARKPADMDKVSYFLEPLYPNQQAAVPDPWYGPASGYKPVFDLIQKAGILLVSQLIQTSGNISNRTNSIKK